MLSSCGYGFLKKKNLFLIFKNKDIFNRNRVKLLAQSQSDKLDKIQRKQQGTKIINLKKKITEAQFNLTVNVYNGCKWVPIIITNSKIGKSYKDFILTKRMGNNIHRLKKKKNK